MAHEFLLQSEPLDFVILHREIFTSDDYTGWAKLKGATVHFPEYLENNQKIIT